MHNRMRHSALIVGTFLLGVHSAVSFAQVLFVANFKNNSITVYTQTANGNVAPLRTIAGASTGLNGPFGVAADAVNNELFVTNSNNSITVYPLDANGNVSPSRTLAGAATGLNSPLAAFVDPVNNEIVVANNFDPGTVTVYSRTANGNAAPIRTLSGAATGVLFPISATVDTTNNELYIANNNGSSTLSSITVYTRTANGNTAPLRTISGATTDIVNPDGTALDLVNNELLVADCNNYVSAFSRTANGNVAPLRRIIGAATGLNCAIGLAVDTTANEVEVTSYFTDSVNAYSRTANGNVAPIRSIAGAGTGLAGPGYLAVAGASAPPPPVLASAVSRKVHGSAGTFDLPLSTVPTNPTTEPRQGPAQMIVFTFDKAISAATATITEGTASAATPTFSGNSVSVGLTGVSDRQYVTIALTNVASTDGGTGGSAGVRAGFLVGDVNQNRVVSVADLGLINAQLAQPVTAANFLKDVNASGTLSLADKAIANANLTRNLPAP
jgi:hypothetical protein